MLKYGAMSDKTLSDDPIRDSHRTRGNDAPGGILSEYGENYFQSHNYADRPLGRFSMYWFARRYYARLVRRYAPRRGGRLLELGSGLGHLLGLLQDDFACVGIDIAHYAAQQTLQNAPQAAVMVASADALQVFSDDSFDVVIALHLVEHLIDPATCVRHVQRILTEGGVFLFATPNPTYALRPLKEMPDAIAKDPTHTNVHPPEQWRAWVEASGLSVRRMVGDGLWDVPYLRLVPRQVQFAVFGLPSLIQVLSGRPLLPAALGVNVIVLAQK